MEIGNWVLIVLGLVAVVGGYFMITNGNFQRWILSYGRGKLWVKILGESRAYAATRWVFGPITLLFGIALVLGGAFGGPIGK